ncbi:MAG: DNA-processing protein DprA [Clostridia bacterium]
MVVIVEERVYWLWLQHAFGAGSTKPASIARRYESIEAFYKEKRWNQFDFISDSELNALKSYTLDYAQAQIEYCEKMGQTVISYGDYNYPDKLRHIENPPSVLFVKGTLPDFDDNLTISIVGSRKASSGALMLTEKISRELSIEGTVVVSGGALGVDTAAHKGAMKGTSPTVAILPCSLDFPYLMQNQKLRNQIIETGGALISEYPVNSAVYKGNFVIRNRIISGLCNGLLVSEAAVKSGTMITVAHATRQNKDIFAFPGDVNSLTSSGSNKLIVDGATPVLDVKDILDGYKCLTKGKNNAVNLVKDDNTEKITNLGLSKNAQMIYTVLTKTPVHVTTICEITDLKISKVLASITELELMGYIKTYSGQRCSLI